jgi:hypothetical protein
MATFVDELEHGVRTAFLILFMLAFHALAQAQTLTSSNVQINWAVENRFRLFREADTFKTHLNAWQQYKTHVAGLGISDEEKERLISSSSVLGAEHVLNDRFIPFTRIQRRKYDWRGWAAKAVGDTCWDAKSRTHAACGGVERYVTPSSHAVRLWLSPLTRDTLMAEFNCEWRVGEGSAFVAPCDEAVVLDIPWPKGATVTVNAEGEAPIATDIVVKDLLVVGLGDSFASGEGNPDVPVAFSATARHNNVYPKRARNDASGNAQWMDELCHRSLYGHQLRAALQVAVENPQSAVTFMGYACSGAAVGEGVLGPQEHMDYVSRDGSPRVVSGSDNDNQMRWLLRELCAAKPEENKGFWTCPGGQYRRPVDLLLLSVGGNDIGFSNLVAWATLRDNTTSSLAKFFGATVSPKQFSSNMKNDLPQAYARLARALEVAVPLGGGEGVFDASRVVLTAYPDILEDERGQVCTAGEEGEKEDLYPANQSMDFWSGWLVVTPKKLLAAHGQLQTLHRRMGELAEDHGWQFAGRAYEGRPFRGHGFCARNSASEDDPAEQLIMPCAGKSKRPTATCTLGWSGKQRDWRPWHPETENFPYALRQRWVRTFNDVYLAINQKVITRDGQIDEEASASVFSETTGAMHPSAEGHAAMADAILLDIRAKVAQFLAAP